MINKKQTTNSQNAFTLVELIVVIVILAILATIAFVAFSSYWASSRDSQRVSDITSAAKWLQAQEATANKYPVPDEAIPIQEWTVADPWSVIWFQWEVWKNVKTIIKSSW